LKFRVLKVEYVFVRARHVRNNATMSPISRQERMQLWIGAYRGVRRSTSDVMLTGFWV
jgi:hypothetical protein